MNQNKFLLDCLYQRKNISRIEELIEENSAKLNGLQVQKEQDDVPVLKSAKECQALFDQEISAALEEILETQNYEKPQIILVKESFFHKSWAFFRYVYSASMYKEIKASFLVKPTEREVEFPWYYLNPMWVLFNLERFTSSDWLGKTDPFHPERIYISPSGRAQLILTLAHETAHSIHFQTKNYNDKFEENILSPVCAEGIAEAVAVRTGIILGREDRTLERLSYERSQLHLFSAYHYLCDEYPTIRRKLSQQQGQRFPLLRSYRSYSEGYTAIELLCQEHGDLVIKKLISNEEIPA